MSPPSAALIEASAPGASRAGRWAALAALTVAVVMVVALGALVAVLGVRQQLGCAPSSAAAAEGTADPISLPALEIATRVFQVGRDERAGERHILAAFAAVLVESGGGVTMTNPAEGLGSSVGAFQQQDHAPWTTQGRNRRNIRDAARSFFEQARRQDRPGLTVGQLAQAVQASGYPHRYELAVDRARQFLARVKARSEAGGRYLVAAAMVPVVAARVLERTAPAEPVRLSWPTQVRATTSPFGGRAAPCAGCSSFHEGLDIAAPHGAPVHAAAAGTLVQRGPKGGYGNYVCLRHQPRLSTCYAHLSRFGRPQLGDRVAESTVIGYVGATGIGTGAHLHFEVRTSGDAGDPAIDPLPLLQGAPAPTGAPGADIAACATAQPVDATHGIDAPPGPVPGRLVAIANQIERKRLAYCWGGGHAQRPGPSHIVRNCWNRSGDERTHTATGLDCSGAVRWLLTLAGFPDPGGIASGDYGHVLRPGPGRHATVFFNDGHIFIVIDGRAWETSRSNPAHGPGWSGRQNFAGFQAGHLPGM